MTKLYPPFNHKVVIYGSPPPQPLEVKSILDLLHLLAATVEIGLLQNVSLFLQRNDSISPADAIAQQLPHDVSCCLAV